MGSAGHNGPRYADDNDDGRYYVDVDDVIIHNDGTVHLDNDEHQHHFHLVNDDDGSDDDLDLNDLNDYAEHDDNVAAFFANYRRRFLHHLDQHNNDHQHDDDDGCTATTRTGSFTAADTAGRPVTISAACPTHNCHHLIDGTADNLNDGHDSAADDDCFDWSTVYDYDS